MASVDGKAKDNGRPVGGAQVLVGLAGCCQVFGFYSEKMGAIGGFSAGNEEI